MPASIEQQFTPAKRRIFLDALGDGASITKAAERAGVTRISAYNHRESDPYFRLLWDDAIEAGTDRLEDEAMRRAKDGWDEPVYYKGEPVGEVRKYSDRMLAFLLRARRPEKFAPVTNVEQLIRELAREAGADEERAVAAARDILAEARKGGAS